MGVFIAGGGLGESGSLIGGVSGQVGGMKAHHLAAMLDIQRVVFQKPAVDLDALSLEPARDLP